MTLKKTTLIMLFTVFFSQQATAESALNQVHDNSYKENEQETYGQGSLDTSCGKTSGRTWKNVELKTVFADTTSGNGGFYITSYNNEVWRVDQANNYPQNIYTKSMRDLAKAAVLSGVKINICGKENTTPATAWIIELAP